MSSFIALRLENVAYLLSVLGIYEIFFVSLNIIFKWYMDVDSIPGAQYLIYICIYHFWFYKKLMLCCLPLYLISVHFSVFMTAFALYILIKCFSKHKCFYSYSSIMDFAFTPYKMTYKMALVVQKSIIFFGFYFDHIMTSVYFFVYSWLGYFWWSLYFYLLCVTFSICFCKSPIVLSFGVCCYNREI